MKLEVSKFYKNKTRLFLLPCLLHNGPEFQMRFNRVYKFAVGIHDTSLNNHNLTEEPLIYILLDKELSRKYFTEFINWLKGQDYFVKDYVSSPDLSSRKHMIILRIPKLYHNAYQAFMNGRYSEMYTEEQKVLLFKEHHRQKALKVIDKTHDALLDYVQQINAIFEHDLTPAQAKEHSEYAFPLIPQHEIFNYSGTVDDREFNKNYNKVWMEIEVKNQTS